ncbi:DUF418 domain-containing protein [Nesterenkonia muleiensis]|uniref:DUF418 domain-containing protein n=1 Tax=Nesterenkonia muleiensis TaxID=2282648 RepID=UPI000E762D7E|nr:DUF418 domain-containing protein [Nesterenkonia muleiensis]
MVAPDVRPADVEPTARLQALDITRALAIIGMVIVNVGAVETNGAQELVVSVPHGRAAILFIVLAGLGVTFLARSTAAKNRRLWPVILWRAAVLLVLGLALQLLPAGVNVILTLYAALFLLAVFAVRMPTPWVVVTAAVSALAGPAVYILLRTSTGLSTSAAAFGSGPLEAAASILLTGPYPLIVWIAPFLVGIWWGRLDLRAPRVQWRLTGFGVAAAGGAYLISRLLILILGEPEADRIGVDHLLLASGHSQMPLWLLSSVGSSAAVLGLMLIITPRLGRALSPLAATGQLALTAYCAHLVAIAVVAGPDADSPYRGLLLSLTIVIGLIGLCTAWRAAFARGPLESLLRLPSPPKR